MEFYINFQQLAENVVLATQPSELPNQLCDSAYTGKLTASHNIRKSSCYVLETQPSPCIVVQMDSQLLLTFPSYMRLNASTQKLEYGRNSNLLQEAFCQ